MTRSTREIVEQPDAELLLDGLSAIAVQLDDDLIVRRRVGRWLDLPVGVDARDAVPALVGMEAEMAAAKPSLDLPYVSLGDDQDTVIALSAERCPKSGALWLLIRNASEEAALQRELVQNHNALAIAQREIVRARDAALAADRVKTAFLGNVSHELRTPLNVVIGGAEILMKPRNTPLSTEEVSDFAGDIRESGLLLLQLVNDLLDMSAAESGDLSLNEEWCNIAEIVEDTARLARSLPDASALQIETEITDPPPFMGDPLRIKQILFNLISNAVKVSPPGAGVRIGALRLESGALALTVVDQGPGMSEEQLAIAMEPFGQPDPSLRGRGAGLGLSIASRLAKLHDGALDIRTAPGAGLTATALLGGARFAPSPEGVLA